MRAMILWMEWERISIHEISTMNQSRKHEQENIKKILCCFNEKQANQCVLFPITVLSSTSMAQ